MGMSARARIDRRAVLAAAMGAAFGSALWWKRARRTPLERVAIWLADRGAGQVVGLNSELLHRVVIPVVHPVALQPASGGGVWVVSRLRGADAHEWLLFDASGELRSRGELAGFRCSRADGRGGFWALVRGGMGLERRGADGSVEFGPDARELRSTDGRGASKLAANSNGELLAWCVQGELGLIEGEKSVRRECLREEVLDVCGDDRGWWVLTESRLLELDSGLTERRVWRAPERAARLFESSTGSGVWVLDRLGKRATLVGDRTREWRTRKWRLAGVSAFRELNHEAILAAAPGALIVLDRSGEPRAGQGGFDHLVAAALASDFGSPTRS